jgi:hypothetical protein
MSETPVLAAAPVTTVAVKNHIDPDKLKADLAYSLTNLSDAMMHQAGLHAHYTELLARCSRQVDDIELVLEVQEAKAFRKIRDALVAEEKKVVVSEIERDVRADPTIIAVKRALNAAKQVEATAKGAVKAFEQRKDMLVQHGADGRQEREGDLRTMGRLQREANDAAVVERLRQRVTQQGT